MKARILWIEGKRADSPSFVPGLVKKDFSVEAVSTGTAALNRLLEFDPDLVVINAASLRTNGKRICKSIREKVENIPIIVITSADQDSLNALSANVVLSLPFTTRKLINRISPFVPSDAQNILHAGPIRLDLKKKQVRCQGREARLTPRLTQLLHILIQNQGVVMKREDLFRLVWNTEYTGDTRTLDVHVSWLRQAIEEDPRKPRFLKTVRQLGYRLDIEK